MDTFWDTTKHLLQCHKQGKEPAWSQTLDFAAFLGDLKACAGFLDSWEKASKAVLLPAFSISAEEPGGSVAPVSCSTTGQEQMRDIPTLSWYFAVGERRAEQCHSSPAACGFCHQLKMQLFTPERVRVRQHPNFASPKMDLEPSHKSACSPHHQNWKGKKSQHLFFFF